jgi:hypothetical protein
VITLEVEGIPMLTLGDFTQLIEALRDDAHPLGTLAAWRNFEQVDPRDLYCALDVTCRLFLRHDEKGDVARKVINAAVERQVPPLAHRVGIGVVDGTGRGPSRPLMRLSGEASATIPTLPHSGAPRARSGPW